MVAEKNKKSLVITKVVQPMTITKPKPKTDKNQAHFVAKLFKQLCLEEKIDLRLEPDWKHVGRIRRRNGKFTYFRATNFDLNGQGAAEIASDKGYATYFLNLAGYRTIPTKIFQSDDFSKHLKNYNGPLAAYDYAKKTIGLPVIIKPNSLSRGILVCLIYDQREFFQAVKKISRLDRNFLVQPYIPWRDYRIVVLDGKIISAYERLPLSVTGDGHSTINQLLAKKQGGYRANGRDTIINLADFRIDAKLKRRGWKRTTILKPGQIAALLDNCNLSSGGQAVDLGDQIDQSFKKLAIKITRDLGLRFCGVDLMVKKDIRLPLNPRSNNYYVIEINAAPGLDHYAESGAGQKKVVKEMYREILKKLTQ